MLSKEHKNRYEGEAKYLLDPSSQSFGFRPQEIRRSALLFTLAMVGGLSLVGCGEGQSSSDNREFIEPEPETIISTTSIRIEGMEWRGDQLTLLKWRFLDVSPPGPRLFSASFDKSSPGPKEITKETTKVGDQFDVSFSISAPNENGMRQFSLDLSSKMHKRSELFPVSDFHRKLDVTGTIASIEVVKEKLTIIVTVTESGTWKFLDNKAELVFKDYRKYPIDFRVFSVGTKIQFKVFDEGGGKLGVVVDTIRKSIDPGGA